MKQVIHIFGASGAGTSTLGRYICEKTGFFFMDTDDYFWMPTDPQFTTKRPKEERLTLMHRDIDRHENVVISGSLVDWGDELIPEFTLAIRISTNTDVRISRLQRRERQSFGDRIDEGGDMHQQFVEFIDWASRYDTGDIEMRSKANHDLWEQKLHCQLLKLDGSQPKEVLWSKLVGIIT